MLNAKDTEQLKNNIKNNILVEAEIEEVSKYLLEFSKINNKNSSVIYDTKLKKVSISIPKDFSNMFKDLGFDNSKDCSIDNSIVSCIGKNSLDFEQNNSNACNILLKLLEYNNIKLVIQN